VKNLNEIPETQTRFLSKIKVGKKESNGNIVPGERPKRGEGTDRVPLCSTVAKGRSYKRSKKNTEQNKGKKTQTRKYCEKSTGRQKLTSGRGGK